MTDDCETPLELVDQALSYDVRDLPVHVKHERKRWFISPAHYAGFLSAMDAIERLRDAIMSCGEAREFHRSYSITAANRGLGYLRDVAPCDGEVMPGQYRPDMIRRLLDATLGIAHNLAQAPGARMEVYTEPFVLRSEA